MLSFETKFFIVGILGPIAAFLVIFGLVMAGYKIFSKKKKIRKMNDGSNYKKTGLSKIETEIKWEITRDENKKRSRNSVLIIFLFSFPIFVIAFMREYFKSKLSLMESAIFFTILILGFVFVYIINFIFPYRKREYKVNNSGIFVLKGSKSHQYSWEDFEYFYINPNEEGIEEDPKTKKLFESLDKKRGRKFYIKIKQFNWFSGFFPVALAIHAEPDNYDKVFEALSKKLPQEKAIQMGMIRYIFK